MTRIHPAAAHGFAREAVRYARSRPDYPAAIQNWLSQILRLGSNATVLELGAGTGKFTRYLADTGARVIAVEPVSSMREQLRAALPQIEIRDGTADAIPCDTAVVDAVVCAQSFHWFATPAALAEIHRTLKPGGHLGLVWNVHDLSVQWMAEIAALLAPHKGKTPQYHSGEWRAIFPAPGFGPLQETHFPHSQAGPPEQVIVDRSLSTSFIAVLPQEQKDALAQQLRALIAATPELAGQAIVTIPYDTAAYSCMKLAG